MRGGMNIFALAGSKPAHLLFYICVGNGAFYTGELHLWLANWLQHACIASADACAPSCSCLRSLLHNAVNPLLPCHHRARAQPCAPCTHA